MGEQTGTARKKRNLVAITLKTNDKVEMYINEICIMNYSSRFFLCVAESEVVNAII